MFFRLFNFHHVEEAYSQIMRMLQQILKGEKAIMDKFDVLEEAVAEAVRVNNEALDKINEDVGRMADQVSQINDLVAQLGDAQDDPEQIAELVKELSASTDALKGALDEVVVPPPVEVPPVDETEPTEPPTEPTEPPVNPDDQPHPDQSLPGDQPVINPLKR